MRRLLIKRGVGKFSVALILSIQLFGLITPGIIHAATGPVGGSGPTPPSVFSSQSTLAAMSVLWSETKAATQLASIGSTEGCTFNPRLADSQDAVDGKWFSGNVNIGLHVEGDDGRAKCDNSGVKWMSHLLNTAGAGGDINQAYKDILNHHNTSNPNSSDYAPDLSWFFSNKIFGGSPIPSQAPDRITYDIVYRAFTSGKGCGAVPKTTNDSAVGKTSATIYTYDQNTNTVKAAQVYVYDQPQNHQVKVGFGLPGDGGNDGIMECRTLASMLGNRYYADAVVAWANEYKAANGNLPTGTPSTPGTGQVPPSCETKGNGPLVWIFCGVISVLDDIISTLDTQIQNLLSIDDAAYKNDGVKKTWGTLRNIALLLLVPIMMVMVIGTALDFGPFDPYTVRKALPRMLAATIFISLSWYITTFLVNMANSVGDGVLGLLTAAFSNTDIQSISLASLFQARDGALFSGLVAGTIGVTAATGTFTIGIAGSYALVAAISLFIGFIILVLRQVVIIGLIMFAPLAILVWIFPGNDKFWKLWWESFSKLLMMFPIIMGLIALGRIFANIIATTSAGSQVPMINTLLTLTAYLAPYFFIPTTFKLAGGIFATIAGITNDRGRGIFDRQKKMRQAKQAEGWQAFKTGSGDGQGITGRMRRSGFVRRTGLGLNAGAKNNFGFGTRGGEKMDQLSRNGSADLMKTAQFNAIQDDDAALQAATYRSATEARANMAKDFGLYKKDASGRYLEDANGKRIEDTAAVERAVQATKSSIGFGRSQQIAAAQQLVNTGTGYDNMEQMVNTLARASGGNTSTAASLAGMANAATKQKGRWDLAPGFGNLNKLVQAKKDGEELTDFDYDQATLQAISDSTDASTLARTSKPQVFKNLESAYGRMQKASESIAADGTDNGYGVVEREGTQAMPKLTEMGKAVTARVIEARSNSGSMTAGNAATTGNLVKRAEGDIAYYGKEVVDSKQARIYEQTDPLSGKPIYSRDGTNPRDPRDPRNAGNTPEGGPGS